MGTTSFKAKYAGACTYGDQIEPGHMITRDMGGYRHTWHPANHSRAAVPAYTGSKRAERTAPTHRPEIEDGVYLIPEGVQGLVAGTVYKVQHAVHGSGKQYAKRLVAPKREGDKATFAYAPGAILGIRPEYRMTLAQAKEYGALYGVCCNCGRTLTNEDSIEKGIGPVCIKRFPQLAYTSQQFADEDAAPVQVDQATKDRLREDLLAYLRNQDWVASDGNLRAAIHSGVAAMEAGASYDDAFMVSARALL